MPRAVTFALVTVLATPAAGVWAKTVEDRYGPPSAADSDAPASAAPASGWLNWSDKSPAPAPRPARSSIAAEPRPFASTRAGTTLPTSLYGQTPMAGAAQPAPWTSMGRAAQTQASATQAMAQAGQPAHFYSVHRPFGLSPDPIPLPQQFFADGAPDPAAGPPPLPPHPVPGTQAATSPANTAANRARQVEIETADSAAN